MKLREISETLSADAISRSKDGLITARWGFFYSHGRSAEQYADRVAELMPGAGVEGSGRVDKAFKGSATVAQSSHFWVKFRMPAGH